MSSAEPYIDGIYNYCDRWCERCDFTCRCRVFATEKRAAAEPGARDPRNGRFWRILGEILDRAQQMIRKAAEEQGIDLDRQDPAAWQASGARKRRTGPNLLVNAGHAYARLVDRWFAANRAHFEEKETEFGRKLDLELSGSPQEREATQLLEALEVVRWYQYQIPVKLARAIASEEKAGPGVDPVLRSDADGSAKVALIGMDRSLGSWVVLRNAFLASEPQDTALDLLVTLDRLRRWTQRSFPAARTFVRPGLDEPQRDKG
jgi:hypothetical protein